MIDVYPDLDLYNSIYKLCSDYGLKVYDDVEVSNKEYPFIYIQDIHFIPKATKTAYLGRANITINLYDIIGNKKKQSTIANSILIKLMHIKSSKNYNWRCNIDKSGIQYRVDTTTSTKLTRAIVNLEFRLV